MKCLIIDDERLARKELQSLLSEYSEIEVVGECANADEALEAIENIQPDLIFLDIQMPGQNGFELLESLDYMPRVIFVTAYDEYALRAFEVNALDYILKPVDESRLEETINKILKQSDTDVLAQGITADGGVSLKLDDQIFLKDGDKCWFVTLRDIRYFESEGNYIRVFFENFKPLILKSLNNLEKRLNEKDFFRINRKYIVNLKEVIHIEPWFNGGLQIKLKSGTTLEVSRRQASRFKELLSL